MRGRALGAAVALAWTVSAGLSAAWADWREVRTENFVLQGDASGATLRAFAVELERYRALIAALTVGKAEAEPVLVPVYVMSSKRSFENVFNNPDALGVYTKRIDSPIFVANAARDYRRSAVRGARNDTAQRARTVVKHEYVHHFTYMNGPTYWPHWYTEGFAEYLSTFRYEDGAAVIGNPPSLRGWQLVGGKGVPYEDVLTSVRGWRRLGGKALSSEQVSAYYAQAWVATHYLRHNAETAPKIAAYLQAVRTNPNEPVATLEAAFGDLEALADDVRAYHRANSYGALRLPMPAVDPGPYEVVKLDDWESDYRLAVARRFFARKDEARDVLAEEFARLLTKRPDHPGALAEAAHLALDRKEGTAAETFLARLESADPEGAQTHLLRGLVSGGPEARDHYDAARKADPKNARAHYEFARTHIGQANEEALEAALTALDLSAETFEVPLVAATLLSELGYTDDARYLAEPLAVWPRNAGRRARAKRLLDAL